jgi:hypothetical protein
MTKATGRPRGRPRLYPFGDLGVGEHFDVKLRSHGHRTSVAAAAHAYSKRYGGRLGTQLIRFDELGIDRNRKRGTATHVRVTRLA